VLLYSQDSTIVVKLFAHRVPQNMHVPAEAAH
jgi:hypothetical protein